MIKKIRIWLYGKRSKNSKWFYEGKKETLAFFAKYGIPSDDLQRAYYQYTLSRKMFTFFMSIFENVFFGVGLIGLYFLIKLEKENFEGEKKKVVYYKISDNKGILPQTIANSNDIVTVQLGEGISYCEEIKEFVSKCIKRKYLNPPFLFKIIFVIGNYEYIRKKYNPEEIVTSYEGSFSTAMLTNYCEKHGICHTNIMHGEKLFSPNHAYARFNKIYVWDKFYEELFSKELVSCDEYIIYNPWKLTKLPEPNIDELYDFCFYLNIESMSVHKHLGEIIERLTKKGYTICVRFHPSQYNYKTGEKIFKCCNVENPKDVHILQSIANTKKVVSRYSTVLYQAYCMGKEIIIDDLSNKKEFEALKDLDYIMFNKPHRLLSEYIEGDKT